MIVGSERPARSRVGNPRHPAAGLGADNAWRSPLISSRARCASRRSTSSTMFTAARARARFSYYRCMMWCMKRTNIYLAEGQADALDRVAQAAGVSRAELIRELIDRAIGGHPGADLVADLAAIDGSFGILAGEDAFAREARRAHELPGPAGRRVILVDSDVLIEHLRGNTAARDWLVHARQSSGPLAISVVSLTEIAGGMRSPERREVIRLLGSMQRFEVSEQVAWRAATLMRDYRRSHTGIGLGDYLIAATALTEGLELATLNIRHYPMFRRTCPALPDLKAQPPGRFGSPFQGQFTVNLQP